MSTEICLEAVAASPAAVVHCAGIAMSHGFDIRESVHFRRKKQTTAFVDKKHSRNLCGEIILPSD